MIINNEEDVKVKIIIPYLINLGIQIDEIETETSFTFQLGTNTFQVGKEDKKQALGYSDILCKKGEQNLFIIEVKDEGIDISQKEIDQAISYARLVHPIAPFAIVTKGLNFRFFETISKHEITGSDISVSSDYWKNSLTIGNDEILRQRFLALQYFIGYSQENLKAFCRSQVDMRMFALKGDKGNVTKKYIPELFLPPNEILDKFNSFLMSNSQCFSIIGESGVGKSNLMCFLAENYLDQNIVFFYNGTEIVRDIFDSIKDDCNWFFSPHIEIEEICSSLISFTNDERKLLLFIDAIDEVSLSNLTLILNELSIRIKRYNNFKLCISCKSTEWNKFLTIKGNPSNLLDIIYTEEQKDLENVKSNDSKKDNYSYNLTRFNDDELKQLDQKYRAIYKYKGEINYKLRSELKLGFTLRVFAQVYSNKNVPKSFNDITLLEEYLHKVLEKLDFETAHNCLCLIETGKAILEGNKNVDNYYWDIGKVDELYLREKLNLNINEKINPDLFAYNILTRVTDYNGNSYISFYFGRLRNFIIGHKVLKLFALTDQEFENRIDELIQNSVSREALVWYYQNAKYNHKKIFEKYYHSKAIIFLNTYESLINNNFCKIKENFDPFTKGEIGLIITKTIDEGLVPYAFYQLSDFSNEKLKIVDNSFLTFGNETILKLGVKSIRSSRNNFWEPEKEAKKIIKEKLKEIIEHGNLYEDENVEMLKEYVLSILFNYSKEIGIELNIKNALVLNLEGNYPIDFNEVLKKIKYIYAQRYYEQINIQELIASGKIIVNKMGNTYSYNMNRSILDTEKINQKAQEAVEQNLKIPEPNIINEVPPFKRLKKAIIKLNKKGIKITKAILSVPDIEYNDIQSKVEKKGGRVGWIPDLVMAQYSDNKIVQYVEEFFTLFLKEYKIIIENNFVGLENNFSLYSKLPVLVYCKVNKNNGWSLIYGMKKISGDNSRVRIDRTSEDKNLWLDSKNEYDLVRFNSIDNILYYTPTRLLNPEKSTHNCVLRNFIYEWISNEVKNILE